MPKGSKPHYDISINFRIYYIVGIMEVAKTVSDERAVLRAIW